MLPSMSAIAPSPAPCKRFAVALTDDGALLGADVVRYSFIVWVFHPLSLVGFNRRYQACHGLRPRGSECVLPIIVRIRVDFRQLKIVVLPNFSNFGAQSLQPCGLRPTCLLSYA